jgi:tetratricopeptide (TPR) repeat protein
MIQQNEKPWLAKASPKKLAGAICRIVLAVLAILTTITAVAQSGTKSAAPAAASQREHDDYRAAAAATSGAALEKSAREFSAKYPQSALRVYLFEKALHQFQMENDPAGITETAREILAIDPGDPLALVLTATALADELSAGDPDRNRKISEIKRSAELAIHNLDRGVLPASAAPPQAALYRSTLEAMAYSALGIMKLKSGDDAGAEKDLKTAAELAKARPDPAIWYHLALAQDHRKKYSAAINSVEQAMQLASANPQLQRLAEREHDRLYRLSGRNKNSSETVSNPPPE